MANIYMNEKKEGKKVVNNLFWRFAERCGAQGVTFIVSVVLARILDPSVYGTVAIVTVFTTILQVFVDSGLGNALIQKKNADDIDFSTVFYFNILVCMTLYVGLFLAAPFIAQFYGIGELTAVVRVLGLTIVISGVKNVQQAYVSRNMLFKRFFFSTLGGTIGAAVIGIAMALLGFGVWALVVQNLFNLLIDTIILWITVKWRPKKTFSLERLKGLFSFGWKLLVASILETLYQNLRSLIIAKIYSADDLAYFSRGKQFPNLLVTNINSSIDSVLLPTMSSVQDDKERLKAMTRRSIKTSTFLLTPLMMGLAVCAEPIVRIILTDKWLPCVFFLRVFCFTFAFYPIHTANLNAIKAMGRSDLTLKLGIIKKVIGIAILFATMFISVEAMAYGMAVSSVLSQVVNAQPNKKLLNYSYNEQIKDISAAFLLSGVMGVCVIFVGLIPMNIYISLALQIIVGVTTYILLAFITKNESFLYILSMVKTYIKK